MLKANLDEFKPAFSKYFCQIPAHTRRRISNLAKNSRVHTLLAQWPYLSTTIPFKEPAGIVTTQYTPPGQNTTKNLINTGFISGHLYTQTCHTLNLLGNERERCPELRNFILIENLNF